MMDIVERLRAGQQVSQFNRAGVLERYQASPAPIDLEAADEIERLRAAVLEEREACAAIVDAYRHATIYRDAVRICDRIIADIRARTSKVEP